MKKNCWSCNCETHYCPDVHEEKDAEIATLKTSLQASAKVVEELRNDLRHVKACLTPHREADLGLCGLYEYVRDAIKRAEIPPGASTEKEPQ